MKERSLLKLNGKCLDCGFETTFVEKDEYYMIHDELWLQANPRGKGKLCIGCIEQRLGRRLVPADFTDCSLNRKLDQKSDRLRSRLINERD